MGVMNLSCVSYVVCHQGGYRTSTIGLESHHETRQSHRHLRGDKDDLVGWLYHLSLKTRVRGKGSQRLSYDRHANGVETGGSWTSFIHGGYRAPALISALCDGPSIGLTTG